jgi:hypothetical protein
MSFTSQPIGLVSTSPAAALPVGAILRRARAAIAASVADINIYSLIEGTTLLAAASSASLFIFWAVVRL